MLFSAPLEVARTKAWTLAPSSTSASVRWEPMKPSAPVTSTVRPAELYVIGLPAVEAIQATWSSSQRSEAATASSTSVVGTGRTLSSSGNGDTGVAGLDWIRPRWPALASMVSTSFTATPRQHRSRTTPSTPLFLMVTRVRARSRKCPARGASSVQSERARHSPERRRIRPPGAVRADLLAPRDRGPLELLHEGDLTPRRRTPARIAAVRLAEPLEACGLVPDCR